MKYNKNVIDDIPFTVEIRQFFKFLEPDGKCDKSEMLQRYGDFCSRYPTIGKMFKMRID